MPCAALFFSLLWTAIALEGCEKPECTGGGTMDLGTNQGLCDQAWIHGEQMCPERSICGVVVSCTALSEWSFGSCTCQDAPDRRCCPIAITGTADGEILGMEDDVDPETPGFQIEITVDIDCWYPWWVPLHVHVCDQDPGENVRNYEPSFDTLVPAVVDLGTQTGCFSICAEMIAYERVKASDTVQVCVE